MEQLPNKVKVLVLFNGNNLVALYNFISVSMSISICGFPMRSEFPAMEYVEEIRRPPRILYEALLVRKSAMRLDY